MVSPCGEFVLVPEVHVRCVVEKVQMSKEKAPGAETGAVAATQSNAGALLPVSIWADSPFVRMMWATRWAPGGLMPVRPQVLLVEDVVLPAKRAVWLTAC